MGKRINMENVKGAIVTAIVIAGLLGILVGVIGITLAATYKYKQQLNQCLCLDTLHRNGAVLEVKVINPSK